MKGYVYVGKKLIERVSNVTEIDYIEEAKGDLISADNLVDMVEELLKERKRLLYSFDEKVEDLKNTEDIDYEYQIWKDMQWEDEQNGR